MCLYRILQESLNNVVKHAGASQVAILISKKARSVDLMIQDDGCGFEAQDSEVQQNGLSKMRDRALLAEGTFTVESIPGDGTKSRLVLPPRVSPGQST
ncbi:ATP-binding protein [bacterium]|nr:ATP-binding protein [bacterium]